MAAEFLPKTKSKRWVQIDISDGKFTKAKSWNEPEQLKELRITNYELQNVKLEIHLMVNNLKPNFLKWLEIADRIIFHFENLDEVELSFIEKLKSKKSGPEFGLAITMQTPVQIIMPFLSEFKFIQLLAVNPGYSGGEFNRETLKKIKFIKKNYPKVVIEIDGGMNEKTAKLVKKAGADIINSASYIFDSKNPKEAYQKLSLV